LGKGSLSGTLKATNTSSVACGLLVKPALYPLDSAGHRLSVGNFQSADLRVGPPDRLLPAATALSTVDWSSWCKAKASGRVEVEWGTGVATAGVTDGSPTTPACVAGAQLEISSTWFAPLS
jgi:hypothetical protein